VEVVGSAGAGELDVAMAALVEPRQLASGVFAQVERAELVAASDDLNSQPHNQPRDSGGGQSGQSPGAAAPECRGTEFQAKKSSSSLSSSSSSFFDK